MSSNNSPLLSSDSSQRSNQNVAYLRYFIVLSITCIVWITVMPLFRSAHVNPVNVADIPSNYINLSQTLYKYPSTLWETENTVVPTISMSQTSSKLSTDTSPFPSPLLSFAVMAEVSPFHLISVLNTKRPLSTYSSGLSFLHEGLAVLHENQGRFNNKIPVNHLSVPMNSMGHIDHSLYEHSDLISSTDQGVDNKQCDNNGKSCHSRKHTPLTETSSSVSLSNRDFTSIRTAYGYLGGADMRYNSRSDSTSARGLVHGVPVTSRLHIGVENGVVMPLPTRLSVYTLLQSADTPLEHTLKMVQYIDAVYLSRRLSVHSYPSPPSASSPPPRYSTHAYVVVVAVPHALKQSLPVLRALFLSSPHVHVVLITEQRGTFITAADNYVRSFIHSDLTRVLDEVNAERMRVENEVREAMQTAKVTNENKGEMGLRNGDQTKFVLPVVKLDQVDATYIHTNTPLVSERDVYNDINSLDVTSNFDSNSNSNSDSGTNTYTTNNHSDNHSDDFHSEIKDDMVHGETYSETKDNIDTMVHSETDSSVSHTDSHTDTTTDTTTDFKTNSKRKPLKGRRKTKAVAPPLPPLRTSDGSLVNVNVPMKTYITLQDAITLTATQPHDSPTLFLSGAQSQCTHLQLGPASAPLWSKKPYSYSMRAVPLKTPDSHGSEDQTQDSRSESQAVESQDRESNSQEQEVSQEREIDRELALKKKTELHSYYFIAGTSAMTRFVYYSPTYDFTINPTSTYLSSLKEDAPVRCVSVVIGRHPIYLIFKPIPVLHPRLLATDGKPRILGFKTKKVPGPLPPSLFPRSLLPFTPSPAVSGGVFDSVTHAAYEHLHGSDDSTSSSAKTPEGHIGQEGSLGSNEFVVFPRHSLNPTKSFFRNATLPLSSPSLSVSISTSASQHHVYLDRGVQYDVYRRDDISLSHRVLVPSAGNAVNGGVNTRKAGGAGYSASCFLFSQPFINPKNNTNHIGVNVHRKTPFIFLAVDDLNVIMQHQRHLQTHTMHRHNARHIADLPDHPSPRLSIAYAPIKPSIESPITPTVPLLSLSDLFAVKTYRQATLAATKVSTGWSHLDHLVKLHVVTVATNALRYKLNITHIDPVAIDLNRRVFNNGASTDYIEPHAVSLSTLPFCSTADTLLASDSPSSPSSPSSHDQQRIERRRQEKNRVRNKRRRKNKLQKMEKMEDLIASEAKRTHTLSDLEVPLRAADARLSESAVVECVPSLDRETYTMLSSLHYPSAIPLVLNYRTMIFNSNSFNSPNSFNSNSFNSNSFNSPNSSPSLSVDHRHRSIYDLHHSRHPHSNTRVKTGKTGVNIDKTGVNIDNIDKTGSKTKGNNDNESKNVSGNNREAEDRKLINEGLSLDPLINFYNGPLSPSTPLPITATGDLSPILSPHTILHLSDVTLPRSLLTPLIIGSSANSHPLVATREGDCVMSEAFFDFFLPSLTPDPHSLSTNYTPAYIAINLDVAESTFFSGLSSSPHHVGVSSLLQSLLPHRPSSPHLPDLTFPLSASVFPPFLLHPACVRLHHPRHYHHAPELPQAQSQRFFPRTTPSTLTHPIAGDKYSKVGVLLLSSNTPSTHSEASDPSDTNMFDSIMFNSHTLTLHSPEPPEVTTFHPITPPTPSDAHTRLPNESHCMEALGELQTRTELYHTVKNHPLNVQGDSNLHVPPRISASLRSHLCVENRAQCHRLNRLTQITSHPTPTSDDAVDTPAKNPSVKNPSFKDPSVKDPPVKDPPVKNPSVKNLAQYSVAELSDEELLFVLETSCLHNYNIGQDDEFNIYVSPSFPLHTQRSSKHIASQHYDPHAFAHYTGPSQSFSHLLDQRDLGIQDSGRLSRVSRVSVVNAEGTPNQSLDKNYINIESVATSTPDTASLAHLLARLKTTPFGSFIESLTTTLLSLRQKHQHSINSSDIDASGSLLSSAVKRNAAMVLPKEKLFTTTPLLEIDVYVGYEANDRVWDNPRHSHMLRAYLSLLIGDLPIHVQFVKLSGHKNAPAWSWNELSRIAYDDSCDYLLQLNDDTSFHSQNWLLPMLYSLQHRPIRNLGVSGLSSSPSLLHMDTLLVHRTHIDLFNGLFLPVYRNIYATPSLLNMYSIQPAYIQGLQNVVTRNNVQGRVHADYPAYPKVPISYQPHHVPNYLRPLRKVVIDPLHQDAQRQRARIAKYLMQLNHYEDSLYWKYKTRKSTVDAASKVVKSNHEGRNSFIEAVKNGDGQYFHDYAAFTSHKHYPLYIY